MISVPPFLLKRLYVKGSLHNNSQGFELQLKNTLGSGYAREVLPVSVDGQELPLESCFFSVDGTEAPFSAVSAQNPFTLSMNRASIVTVKGTTLTPGAHRIGIGFVVQGLGRLSFEITDVVS